MEGKHFYFHILVDRPSSVLDWQVSTLVYCHYKIIAEKEQRLLEL